MIPTGSRLALWCLALLLSLSLYLKGRLPTDRKGEGAAFLRSGVGAGTVVVRLAGDFPRPGLYRFPDGASVGSAIRMTLPDTRFSGLHRGEAARRLRSGEVVTLELRGAGPPRFSVADMGVKERMLLGIPLDPDLLKREEWLLLPGIGPVLSERILADRHKNGAFGSLDALLRVPGIGPGKLAGLRKYF